MKKCVITSSVEGLPTNVKEIFPERDYFSVKFQGKIYDDAWKDKLGHVWFGNNRYEYLPKDELLRDEPYVNIHDSKSSGRGFETSISKSRSKVEFL